MSEAATLDADSNGGLPLVGQDSGNRGLWIGLGAIGIGGLLLFALLESSRQGALESQIISPQDYAYATAPKPALVVPQDYMDDPSRASSGAQNSRILAPAILQLPPVRLTRVRPSGPTSDAPQPPAPSYVPPTPFANAAPEPDRSAPTIVYDGATPPAAAIAAVSGAAPQATKAVAFGGGDRTFLVAQGTLIFAVLETALDSTQSGQARAMITTDVYNALGRRVLIPKGSRIFGEYKGELGAGQNRAQIVWTRLIRPDGATIALDSPASDPLGRAGVKGRVNTHFGERLLSALLQSTIDFGTYAASRAVTSSNGVVVALPNATQNAGSQILPEVPKSTLKVRHGTRIAVFVARDLDFAGVE